MRRSMSISLPEEWIEVINEYLKNNKTNFSDLGKEGIMKLIPKLKSIKINNNYRDLKSIDKIIEEIETNAIGSENQEILLGLLRKLKINLRG